MSDVILRNAAKEDMSRVLDLIRELAIYENAEEQVDPQIVHIIEREQIRPA